MGNTLFSCVRKSKKMEDTGKKKPSGSTRRKRKASESDSDYSPETKKKVTKAVKTENEPKTRKPRIKNDTGATEKKPGRTKKVSGEVQVTVTSVYLSDSEGNEKKVLKTTKKITNGNAECNANQISVEDNNLMVWSEATMLAHHQKVPKELAQNFIDLLEEGCTLPFIARYRKAKVFHLMPDK